jgi:hypothetical protein
MGILPVAKIISARPRWKAGSLPKTKPFADSSVKKNTKTTVEKIMAKMISSLFSVEPKRFKTVVVSPIC